MVGDAAADAPRKVCSVCRGTGLAREKSIMRRLVGNSETACSECEGTGMVAVANSEHTEDN